MDMTGIRTFQANHLFHMCYMINITNIHCLTEEIKYSHTCVLTYVYVNKNLKDPLNV